MLRSAIAVPARTTNPGCWRVLWLALVVLGFPFFTASGATYIVINTNDAGPGSLRQALLDANQFEGPDRITFAIPGSATRTISPASALPPVIDPLWIDATTQPGYTNQPLIELNGTSAGNTAGLRLLAGASTVRGLVINRFAGSAIQIEGPGTNTIQGNRLGTDPPGTAARPNGLEGVWVYNSAGNLIGGTNSGEGNLISGNSESGIYVQNGSGNVIAGNLVGVTAPGTARLANGINGITVFNAPGNFIGSGTSAGRNIISGNGGSGIYLHGSGARENCVMGNFIGTGIGGAGAISNKADGVTINGASYNRIGSAQPGAGNLISGNGKAGVALNGSGSVSNSIQGNLIGTDATGRFALGNSYAGLFLLEASGNLVGGDLPGARNVISGNRQDGVFLSTNSVCNTVAGNYLGVDASGGSALPNGFNGVSINSANSNTIGGVASGGRNVISGNALYGIQIAAGSTGNSICGNFIGPAPSGTTALANGRSGIRIESAGNRVGSSNVGNVISGNGLDGVVLVGAFASNNLIQANSLGTTPGGLSPLPNGRAGVGISAAPCNIIGGLSSGEGNLISANAEAGIYLVELSATGNRIVGNRIGTDLSGTAPLGNGFEGIYLEHTSGNTLGGTLPGAGNLISANHTRGIFLTNASWNVIAGNCIGTQTDGTEPLGNTFHNLELESGSTNNLIGGSGLAGNTIAFAQSVYAGVRIRYGSLKNQILGNLTFGNGGLGIDLGPFGPNSNDDCDSDTGANNLQNAPVLAQAVAGRDMLGVRGTFNSTPGGNYRLQFFANFSGDGARPGQSQIFLGEGSVSLESSCTRNFSVRLPVTVFEGLSITATATDPSGNSSEFSSNTPVIAAPILITSATPERNLLVTWTNYPPGFVLKEADQLAAPMVWRAVTNLPRLINGMYSVSMPVLPTNHFFRLDWE